MDSQGRGRSRGRGRARAQPASEVGTRADVTAVAPHARGRGSRPFPGQQPGQQVTQPPLQGAWAPGSGAISQQGTSALHHQQGDSAMSHQQGALAMSHQQGTSAMSYQQGASAMSHQQGTSAMSHQQGASAMPHQQGASAMSHQQGASAMSHQQGASAMSYQQGASAMSHQQGTSAMSHQQGASAMPHQQGASAFPQEAIVPQPGMGRGRGRQQTSLPAVIPQGGDRPVEQAMRDLNVRSGAPRSDRETRGGLQRRLRNQVLEANVQPVNLSEKIGTLGQKVNLRTNFATFKTLFNEDFFVYQARFTWPSALSFKRKIDEMKKLQHSGHLPQGPFAFDGMRVYTTALWTTDFETPKQLCLDETKSISLRQVSSGVPGTEQYYNLLNIIFNNVQIFLGQERIGRSYFMPASSANSQQQSQGIAPKVQTFENLALLGGYETSFQRGTTPNNQPITIVHIDRSHRILSQETAHKFLTNAGSTPYGPKKSEILGRQIMTKYNNRTYTVNDIKDNVDILSTFEVEERDTKRTISYLDYFRERYNIELQHKVQSFVISRSKKRDVQKVRRGAKAGDTEASGDRGAAPPEDSIRELLLPSELCFLCGLSESEKTNYQRNRQFNMITKRGPRERVSDVVDFQRWISTNPESGGFLNQWGITFAPEPLSVTGKELPCPTVVTYNPSSNAFDGDLSMMPRNAGPNAAPMRGEFEGQKVKVNTNNKTYRVGVLIREGLSNRQFLNSLEQVSGPMQFKFQPIGNEDIVVVGRDGNIGKDLLSFLNYGYDIVLCAGIRPQDYSIIKACTVDTGLLTQCIVKKNFEDLKKMMSIATKVAIQMACKLGHEPWRIRYSCPRKKTMAIGMDTYHNKSQKRSVHAAVFSCNAAFSRYINVAQIDTGRQEMNSKIPVFFKKGLDGFRSINNGILPERIVVFRDGVGDSQLENMKSVEVEKMKETISEIYRPQPPPHLIVIVVKKRISARFFLQQGQNYINPQPGTIVDTGIVKPNFFEYFLVSQNTRQGTATPTNYNVVEDTAPSSQGGDPRTDSHLSPSEIQLFSYGLTHLYYNWPGTIRVPAPVHYAHRMAFLIGQSLPQFTDVHPSIQDKLFYL